MYVMWFPGDAQTPKTEELQKGCRASDRHDLKSVTPVEAVVVGRVALADENILEGAD